jgi:hypothetical protein
VLRPWEWAPGLPTLLPGGHRLRVIMAGRRRAASTPPLVPTIRVVPAGRAVPADPVATPVVPADPADPVATPVVLAVPVVPADPVTLAVRADPAVLAPITVAPADRVDPVTPVVRADLVVPEARGMATPTVATSTAHRGATDLAPGGLASRRGRHGIDRSLRRVDTGVTARSTTGATRKHPSGIPVSTSGASGSSECGSHCDR